MGRRQQAADRAVRPKLRSPGHPKFQRPVEAAFWRAIAQGLLPEEASAVAGVAQAVGARWFHNAGGMPPFDLDFSPSGRYLRFAEREEIAILRAQGKGIREIARAVGRDPGTISRELRRNAATRGGTREYRASVAQWKADMAAKRPKQAKLVTNPRLREYVEQRLAGKVSRPDGTVVTGPQPPQFAIRSAGSKSRLMPAEATRSVMTSMTVVTANSSNGYITQSLFWPGRRLLGFSDLSGFVVALMLAPPPCPLPPSIVSNLRDSLAFWSFACAVALAFDGRAGVVHPKT